MAETALIFPIPEAEPYVRDLRDRYDPAAADGVPAHITVLYPFIPFEDLSNDVLRRVELIAAKTESFDFRISSTARFPDTFYLQPDPVSGSSTSRCGSSLNFRHIHPTPDASMQSFRT